MELMAMMSMCAVGDWIRHDFGPISPWAYFLRRRRNLDRLLHEQIDLHREAVENGDAPDDILTMLIEARFDDGSSMTDTEIRDELVTLIVAGSETTATSMAWTFDLVTHRPGAVARIVSEAAVGEHAFTDAAIKESLRLRPPVIAAGRVTNRTVELGPWRIPEGVRIWTPMSLIQRDPETFDRPNEFRPERYLEERPKGVTWIPFGGGVRRCLARSFAMLEMRTVVQQVLSNLRLASGQRERGDAPGPRGPSSCRAMASASGSKTGAKPMAARGIPSTPCSTGQPTPPPSASLSPAEPRHRRQGFADGQIRSLRIPLSTPDPRRRDRAGGGRRLAYGVGVFDAARPFGFSDPDSESSRAYEEIEEATRLEASPGVVVVVDAGGPADLRRHTNDEVTEALRVDRMGSVG